MAVFLAVWPSGKAVDCKSSIPSSNLGAAFKYSSISLLFYKHIKYNIITCQLGDVVELVDTTDLKSVA
jgi:hypothetical protein